MNAVFYFVAAGSVVLASVASAQTTLVTSANVVAPGAAVTLTVTGSPGHHFALVGSTVGSGLSFGGANFAVGADVQVITIGLLDAQGRASLGFMPPFAGSTLDRFYVQAVTSASPSFVPPTLSAGVILRNADALATSAGGDLSGTYPNPTIAPGAGGRIVEAINATGGTISDARLSTTVATKSYVDIAVAGAVGVGATAGGDLAGTYPNPTITSAAGGRIVDAINATGGVISDARLSSTVARTTYVDAGDATRIALGPSADQDLATANPLIRVRQRGSGDLLSLRVNSTTVPGAGSALVDQEQFRVLPDGGFVARGAAGIGSIPTTGSGTRISWYPAKAAFRVGEATTEWDDANTGTHSLAGGLQTTASGFTSFAWGNGSRASATAGVTFGFRNSAEGQGSFALGAFNTAKDVDSFAVGLDSLAQGSAAIAIGTANASCGSYSLALGRRAVTATQDPTLTETVGGDACNGTAHSGTFVWSDNSSSAFFRSTANNQFNVRSAGGVRIFTNNLLTAGVTLDAGDSTWNVVSDVNAKTAFRDLDGDEVLRKLAHMPIREWSYKASESVRHVGPTAQDFYSAFGLGSDRLKISTIDPSGIALRAVQALEERTRALARENAQLRAMLEEVLILMRER